MKERGMIFNGEMVRAILDGRKTQTRRIVSPQPELTARSGFAWKGSIYGAGSSCRETNENFAHVACPLGNVGDRIWVRETWQGPLVDANAFFASLDYDEFNHSKFCEYAADGAEAPEFIDRDGNERRCWRPSIHMPRWASRITLEITGVRVERLQDISQDDASSEGVGLTGWVPTYSDPNGGGEVMTPYDNFVELWESIYGPDSWKSNPWVWVIEFKVVTDD